MTTIKYKGIAYLHNNSIEFATTQKPEIIHISFTDEVVRDMEIIDEEKLKTSLIATFEKEKILPTHCLIILGRSVIFSKTLTGKTPEEQEKEKEEYLKNVPFEKVSSKTIKTPKETIILAVNKNYFDNIRAILISLQHTVSAVTHQNFFAKDLTSESTLNTNQAKIIFSWIDSIKASDNFLDQPAPIISESEQLLIVEPKKKKSTLPVLLPVFAVLVIVLVALYLSQQNQQKSYVAKAENRPKVLPSFTPTPTIEPTQPVSTPSAMIISEYGTTSIQVLNGSGVPGSAEKTKKILNDAGFDNVTTGNASTRVSERTLIIYAKKIPEHVRTFITTLIKQTGADVSAQETQKSEYDVIITIGSR